MLCVEMTKFQKATNATTLLGQLRPHTQRERHTHTFYPLLSCTHTSIYSKHIMPKVFNASFQIQTETAEWKSEFHVESNPSFLSLPHHLFSLSPFLFLFARIVLLNYRAVFFNHFLFESARRALKCVFVCAWNRSSLWKINWSNHLKHGMSQSCNDALTALNSNWTQAHQAHTHTLTQTQIPTHFMMKYKQLSSFWRGLNDTNYNLVSFVYGTLSFDSHYHLRSSAKPVTLSSPCYLFAASTIFESLFFALCHFKLY